MRRGDHELAPLYRQPAAGIVEPHAHFGKAGGGAPATAGEYGVFHPPQPHQPRALLAQHPAQGVGDVALAAAVGTDHGGDTRPKIDGRAGGKALETLDFQAFEVQRQPQGKAER